MKILAIIPARGGSKGIPNKNVISLNGYPLIYYTLYALIKTNRIDDIVVSTDDTKIKKIVEKLFGTNIQVMMRPNELATDKSHSEYTIEHVLNNINKQYEYTIFAQCTSPLTEPSDFINLIDTILLGFDCVAFYTEDYSYSFDSEEDLIKIKNLRLPRQLKTPKRKEAGNAWIFKTTEFLKYKTRLFGELGTTLGLCKLDTPKQFEIDELNDIDICKCILKTRTC